MPRYVALFRGINVGNAKRIAMADLRKVLESLGYRDVETLLNSGNAVFEASAEPEAKQAQRIRDAVLKKLKVDSFVVVKSAKDIAAIVVGNKLAKVATNPSLLLVAMSNGPTALKPFESIAKAEWESGTFHFGAQALYLWCPDGTLKSKAGLTLLKKLAHSGTTRNWSTVEKIHAMLQAR